MNSNSAFKNILEINKEYIDTLNCIVKEIKIRRENYIHLENKVLGRSFERDENNKREFNRFVCFDLEKELMLKKYNSFFLTVCSHSKNNDFKNDVIFLKDKNEFMWVFKISEFTIELVELKREFSKFNVVVSHQKYISTVYEEEKDQTLFSFKSKKVLFDLSEKELDINETEILLLTKDIDLTYLLNFNLKNIVFPFISNEKSLKSVYDTKDEANKNKKESLFKRIFKL